MAGHDAEFHRRDLFEAITRGEHPHMDHVGTGHALCRCAAQPHRYQLSPVAMRRCMHPIAAGALG